MKTQQNYIDHYLKINNVYPSVFAIKFFLGNNPKLNFNRDYNIKFNKKKILDIGFGDGRDLVLFHNLGMETYGVEVDDSIISHSIEKFNNTSIKVSKGFNHKTGFKKNSFDFVYSISSLMYLTNKAMTIDNILKHCFDILKPGGFFMGSFTKNTSHVIRGGEKLNNNVFKLKDPYYKFREGQYYYTHKSKSEVKDDLINNGFTNVIVSNYNVDWFGTPEKSFLFFCQKPLE